MEKLPSTIERKLLQRKHDNALRALKQESDLIDFSSNDYLGFAESTDIFETTHQLLIDLNIKKNGAGGSRLLSGNHKLYTEAETILSKLHHAETALIFNSGYDANIGLMSAVPQRGDLILFDEYIHASLRDGIRISNAKAFKFKHNDLSDLSGKIEKLADSNAEIYIVSESIFSMDGDEAPLEQLVEISKKHHAHLIIDEAHATGVIGKKGLGLIQELNLEQDIFARIHTFGKGIGCHGAVVFGHSKLRSFLINFARSFIYTTGLPPHSLANIIVSYETLERTNALSKLRENISYFKFQLAKFELSDFFIESSSAIQCCLIHGNNKVKQVSHALEQEGFDVKAILSPTVPTGKERLRFCIHSFNTFAEIERLLSILKNQINQ